MIFVLTYSYVDTCMCQRVAGADHITCLTPQQPHSSEDSCMWKVIVTERKVMFLFPFMHFSLYTSAVVCYFVYCSLPSSASVSEWKIDPLFCLADTQTCQLLTGYWNTVRTVIVLFIRLTMNTPETQILPAFTFSHTYVWLTSWPGYF